MLTDVVARLPVRTLHGWVYSFEPEIWKNKLEIKQENITEKPSLLLG